MICQVVAVDRENGNNLLAFQHLSTRERGTKDGSVVQNIKVEKVLLNCNCDHLVSASKVEQEPLWVCIYLRLVTFVYMAVLMLQ